MERIRAHTAPYVNERIDLLTRARTEQALRQGRSAIERRIAELDQEWDLDRAMMLNFAIVGGAAFVAGLTRNRGWLYFFGAQIAFLGLHAAVGWCPPSSLFRRLSFRTRSEIEAEKSDLLRYLETREKAA